MQVDVRNLKALKYMRIWWSVSFLMVAGVYAVCLMPIQGPISGPEYADKIWHFVTYVMVMLWFSQLYHPRVQRWILLGVILMGFSIECLQALTPWRSFELMDMVANISGAILGAWMARSELHQFLFNIEARWQKRSV